MHGFRKQENIETQRLLLRRWTMKDMHGFLLFASDPEIMLAAGVRPSLTPIEAHADLKRTVEDPYAYAITLKNTGEIVGKIKYQNDHRRYQTNGISIGYELARKYWGNGYMTEALRAMVRHAFDAMQMDVVGISHVVGNERSRRVIQRAGFILEGIIPRSFRRFDGAVFDDVCYSILREEYLTGRVSSVRRVS